MISTICPLSKKGCFPRLNGSMQRMRPRRCRDKVIAVRNSSNIGLIEMVEKNVECIWI